MFTYLQGIRPGSRRPAPPPPTAPPNANSTRYHHDGHSFTSQTAVLPPPQRTRDANSPSPVSPAPPILPPIPRVASRHEQDGWDSAASQWPDEATLQPELSVQDTQRPRSASQTSELTGIRPPGLGRTSKELPTLPYNVPDRGPAPQSIPVKLAGEPYDPARSTPKPSFNDILGPMRPPPLFQPPQRQPTPLPSPKALLHVRSNTNAAKPGKTKLNLLNPMSLLARRRSSQKVTEATEKFSTLEHRTIPALSLPDDYDPRIRGKVVHDFSAPRSARSNHSPPKSSNGQGGHNNGEQALSQSSESALHSQVDIPSNTEKEHTPVFRENFDDDAGPWQEGREGPTKRSKSSFMYQVALQEAYAEPDPSTLPAFARNLPANFPRKGEPVPTIASPPRAPLAFVSESTLPDSMPKDVSTLPSPPTSPRSKTRSRASSYTDSGFVPAGLPKHFKSDASRFSFDLAGVGSAAQEKLLEEKHRQKAKEKARASAEKSKRESRDEVDEYDEDLDIDDLNDDDDGYEERIPGVNASAEEEDAPGSMSVMPALGSFTPALPPKMAFISTMNPVSEGFSPISPERGVPSQISAITSQASPEISRDEKSLSSHTSSEDALRSQRESGTSMNTDMGAESHSRHSAKPLDSTLPALPPTADHHDDDDMYFDDGMIEDLGDVEGQIFDESVFDEETSRVYGLPIRDLPKQQQPRATSEGIAESKQYDGIISHAQFQSLHGPGNANDDSLTEEMRDSLPDLNQSGRPIFSHTAGLTQDNLAAYHDALAMAANQAALSGRFVRRPSLQSEQSIEQPGLDNDPYPAVGASPSLEVNGYPLAQNIPGSDDYDFDDAESDDPIIAAANAEALENDDEDFYGQEFGFYARKTGSGEYANGGFFGPGIQRSCSGRNVEPALTPITERSEWSNRNSAISLALHGYSPASLPPPQTTPGLPQLADIMHLEEDNMSLTALMKLRRGAWGGSTTSLHSSSGNSGSPLRYLPSMPSNAAALQYQQLNQSNPMLINTQNTMGASTYSLNSATSTSYSGDDSPIASEGSHTLTLHQLIIPPAANPAINPPYMAPSHSNSGSEYSPVRQSSPVRQRPRSELQPKGLGKGHSRNGSKDGERVSYVHETDEKGERWVLEKRRVGEGGIVEVLGREVVEGGRI